MDEPTNGELARRLEDIQRTLNAVVGHPEYDADKRGSEFRLGEVERDLAEERRERGAAIREVNQRITDHEKSSADHRMQWRSLLWTGALPAAVALLAVLVTIWLNHHGGGGGH